MNNTNLLAILLAENDLTDANLIQQYTNEFANITWVQTLSGAINYLSENSPDVILLDLHLEDSMGIDCVKKIRKFSTSPIIILTTTDDTPTAEEAMLNGADDYLIKSNITKQVLFRRIRMVVSRRKYLMSRCANGEARCFNQVYCEKISAEESKNKIDSLIEKLQRLNSILEENVNGFDK